MENGVYYYNYQGRYISSSINYMERVIHCPVLEITISV